MNHLSFRTSLTILVCSLFTPIYSQIEEEQIEIIEETLENEDDSRKKPTSTSSMESPFHLSSTIAFLADESMYIHKHCDSFKVQVLDSSGILLHENVHKPYFPSYGIKSQRLMSSLPLNPNCFDTMLLDCPPVYHLTNPQHLSNSTWDSSTRILKSPRLVPKVDGPNDAQFKIDESGKIIYILISNEQKLQDSVAFIYEECILIEFQYYVFRYKDSRIDTGVFNMRFQNGRLIKQDWYNLDSNETVVLPTVKTYHYTVDGRLERIETSIKGIVDEQLIFSYDSQGINIERIKGLNSKMTFRLESFKED